MSSETHKNWRDKLHEIIYEADTPAGKIFDVILLIFILASIALVMLESVDRIDDKYHDILYYGEWIVTILFSIEYIARVITVRKPWKYIFSFYGIIDLLSTIPMYLSTFFVGSQALVSLRALRLLRVFRILKLARYLGASNQLKDSIIASRVKIAVFTVGFGDIAPQTPLGQFITSIIMILGYGIIAVPTGIVSAEYVRSSNKRDKEIAEGKAPEELHLNSQVCSNCACSTHKDNSKFCHKCGYNLHQ